MKKQWLLYATHEEDVALWSKYWIQFFPNKSERIIMQDNTDVQMT